MSDKKYAIQVKNVKKSFYLPNHKNDSLKRSITQVFKPKDKSVNTFHALNGISFNIEKGDFFGILGRNGSGKSTLLKIIAEIYQPTAGSVTHDGKIVSFIELGVGFKSELTGRENVFLNGAMLGFSKKEMEDMYDEIVEFAELEKFMDQRLKNYSSGMKVRLAFSVAIRAKADILILDEVLAVGDADFQRKCNNYFATLKDNKKTVILVTHGMGAVRDFCNKAVVIEDGVVKFEGSADEAADAYLDLFKKDNARVDQSMQFDEIVNLNAEATISYDTVKIGLNLKSKQDLKDVIIAILIYKGKHQVIRWVSDEDTDLKIDLPMGKSVDSTLSLKNIFPVGSYSVDVSIKSRDRSETHAQINEILEFKVQNESKYKNRVLWRPEHSFDIDRVDN